MRKISTRLWILMLLMILITLVLLWIFQIEFLDRYYLDFQVNGLKKEIYLLADMVNKEKPIKDIKDKADEISIRRIAQVYIFDPDIRLQYSSVEGMQAGINGMYRMMAGSTYGVIDRVKKNKVEDVRQIKHMKFASTMMIIGVPILENDNLRGIIVVNFPLAPVKETAAILKRQLMIITSILIVISLFLTYYFSRAFTKPIMEINRAAHEMAQGNLSIKVDVKSKDELGTLSETMNDLAIQLQKVEQLRRELIANVSHELRTPLSLIKGYAEMVRDVTGANEERRNKHLNIIIEESDRLKGIIEDILNLSQIQSNYLKLNISSFDINPVIDIVTARLSYIKENKSINLKINKENSVTIVTGDETRIEQVVYNLLSNAFKHTHECGSVTINIKSLDFKVMIEIIDDGEGIPIEDIDHIWDRFYKVKTSSVAESQGSGLGLAIVKSILDSHESKYGVESEYGKGSKFWFTLNTGGKG